MSGCAKCMDCGINSDHQPCSCPAGEVWAENQRMNTETAETAIALIMEAYQLLGVPPEQFGTLLAHMAEDFKSGEIGKPERVN